MLRVEKTFTLPLLLTLVNKKVFNFSLAARIGVKRGHLLLPLQIALVYQEGYFTLPLHLSLVYKECLYFHVCSSHW